MSKRKVTIERDPKIQGLGDEQARFNVYCEHVPPLSRYQQLAKVESVKAGELKDIGDSTSNHWRKIFNVYAKLQFELEPQQYATWQQLRDDWLLQANCNVSLLFQPSSFDNSFECNKIESDKELKSEAIHIVMGKTYGVKLREQYFDRTGKEISLFWATAEFAICQSKKLIICPYFDYRQLSNIKITQLVGLINHLSVSKQK
ncbi:DUF6942 family protein [Thalassotalea crassostreae]|uniref:DUF6942 family protein n=1 Tax=Thalassotalea crassostreae TaxID=1763536 RepID=UPI0008392941|nr:hypothetical protein [Thalassotalea crassostreae]